MPAVHTETLAGHGETCRWMSAADVASGDRVLASIHYNDKLCKGDMTRLRRSNSPHRRYAVDGPKSRQFRALPVIGAACQWFQSAPTM